MSVFRWSIPLGARRIMDVVKEGHKSTLSSGKMMALAAGLSVGATVGYIVYRHISSTDSEYLPLKCYCASVNHFYTSLCLFSDDFICDCLPLSGQEPNTEVSKMTLPVEVYRNITRCQARFLDMVSSSVPGNDLHLLKVVKVVNNIIMTITCPLPRLS